MGKNSGDEGPGESGAGGMRSGSSGRLLRWADVDEPRQYCRISLKIAYPFGESRSLDDKVRLVHEVARKRTEWVTTYQAPSASILRRQDLALRPFHLV